MIKTALKHYILEICINMFFSNIKNNFISIKNDNVFRLGNKFIYIHEKMIDGSLYTYHNVIIRHVDNNVYFNLSPIKGMRSYSTVRDIDGSIRVREYFGEDTISISSVTRYLEL